MNHDEAVKTIEWAFDNLYHGKSGSGAREHYIKEARQALSVIKQCPSAGDKGLEELERILKDDGCDIFYDRLNKRYMTSYRYGSGNIKLKGKTLKEVIEQAKGGK